MTYESTADLFEAVRRELAKPGYPTKCKDERAFEEKVWNRLRKLMSDAAEDSAKTCLTSHTWAEGRSPSEWRAFCAAEGGADVNVLGSKNRLDIVLIHQGGTIGVEVKCLGAKRHAAKLTQGIGQAMLALAHRDYTILAIHCGSVGKADREDLRSIAARISAPPRMAIVVVP